MNFENIVEWFLGLGQKYNVNPIIFGSIYVGAIPFFTASITWLVRNCRRQKPILLPAFLAGLFFISAYLYLIVVGKNVPIWVYVFIVALVVFGAISTIRKIRKQINEASPRET